TPAEIVPEWYFLPFYAILRSVPNMVGGVVAMALSVMVFAFMPYLDRSRIPGGAHYRPWYRAMFYVFVADMLALGYVGAHPVSERTLLIGHVATFIYFALFVFLPFMSKLEEKWLIKRGLPPEVEALVAGEARKKSEITPRRRSGDAK
ncbi:MAG: cytochrome b/b6, partial [Gallionella sp.]